MKRGLKRNVFFPPDLNPDVHRLIDVWIFFNEKVKTLSRRFVSPVGRRSHPSCR